MTAQCIWHNYSKEIEAIFLEPPELDSDLWDILEKYSVFLFNQDEI